MSSRWINHWRITYSVIADVRCHLNNFWTTKSIDIKVGLEIVKLPSATEWNHLQCRLVENCGGSIPISKTELDRERMIYKVMEQHRFSTKWHFLDINAKDRLIKMRILFSWFPMLWRQNKLGKKIVITIYFYLSCPNLSSSAEMPIWIFLSPER